MNKFQYKRKYKLVIKKRNFILLLIISIIIGIIITFHLINKKVTPLFLSLAESETEKLATLIINDAVSKQLSEDLKTENLFEIVKDSEGNINSVDFNSNVVNQVLTTTTSSVELNLKYLEEGRVDLLTLPDSILVSYDKKDLEKGIIYRIPMGVVFNNALLSNLGPKVPVKLNLVGSITSNIDVKTTNYGINNALLQVNVNLKVTLEVILPFTKKKKTVENSVPIAIKLIQGRIPSYYSGDSTTPNFTLPIE